jgi:hypothetical protein
MTTIDAFLSVFVESLVIIEFDSLNGTSKGLIRNSSSLKVNVDMRYFKIL